MRNRLQALARRLTNFHRAEEGMEAIQVVMLVAIAAIVLIFVKTVLWPRVQRWAKGNVDDVTN